MDNLTDFGAFVKCERQKQRMYLGQLATLANVSESTVSRIEKGRSVAAGAQWAVLQALGVSLAPVGALAQHYAVLVNGHDSKTWYAAGIAALEDGGRIRLTLPLLARRTLLLRPVADASEAETWPFRVTEREAWPKRSTDT
jgi:transcriptional regulator with XRE-family HTH domain